MKKLLSVASLSIVALFGTSAQAAGSVGSNFDVKVNLTAACKVVTAATPLDFGTYTAFVGASSATPTTDIKFDCTRGLAISSVAFDTGSGAGVIAGLQYGMTVDGGTRVSGTTAAGTADVITYVVTGSMAAGQPGAGAGGAATPQVRTLTVSY